MPCKMHIAVFFDGVGLSIEEPSPLPSNVGRLFRGFGQGALGALLRQRVYISGLGTEMNVNAYEFAKDQAGSISGDMLKSVTLDPAKGVPTDAAKDVGMEILKGKRVGDAIGDTLKGLPGKVRRDVGEAVRNPGRTGVKIVKDAPGTLHERSWINLIRYAIRDSCSRQ